MNDLNQLMIIKKHLESHPNVNQRKVKKANLFYQIDYHTHHVHFQSLLAKERKKYKKKNKKVAR